jgi:hypothetical protein
MNRPCPITIDCPGSDSPLGNFSSEAPDPFLFSRFAFPIFNPNNPIGGHRPPVPPVYFAGDCAGICTSTVSQEDADLCAARQAYICDHTPPDGGTPPSFFFSHAAFCSLPCGSGSIFFWQVPAGAFVGTTQAGADEQANAYACLQAARHAFCLNGIPDEAQTGVPYSATIFVNGADRPPVTFSVVSGALPDGLFLVADSPESVLLQGTPTKGDTFNFTIQARDALGIIVQRAYTITVTSTCSDFWNSVAPSWAFSTFGANSVSNRVGNIVTVSAYVNQALDVSGIADAQAAVVAPIANSFQCTLTITPLAIINAINTPFLQILVQDQITAVVYLTFTGVLGVQTVLTFNLPVGAKPLVDFQASVVNAGNGFDSQLAYAITLG